VWTANNKNYRRSNESGAQRFYNLRGSLLFRPTDKLSALLTASGFLDRSDTQMAQLVGIATLNQVSGVNPLVANSPPAPHNARAADWGPCVNVSGGTPAGVTDPNPIPDTGAGDSNLANRLYDHCEPARNHNSNYNVALRVDFDLTDDIKLTSLSSYGDFKRHATYESDGTIYQDYESFQHGFLKTALEELRLSGSVLGKGNWVVGGNYEWASTWDSFLQTYGISSAVPTFVPKIFRNCAGGMPPGVGPLFLVPGNPNCFGVTGAGVANTSHPLGPTNPNNRQTINTYAFFANVEYPVLESLTLQGGVRYTNQHRDYRGCGSDGGDGTWSNIAADIQELLQYFNNNLVITPGVIAGPGKCASTGPAPTFAPVPSGFTDKLNEDNVSWRVGINWNITDNILAYFNVSQGYKSGSFPTVASAAFTQLKPATQEDLLAYEVGTKATLFDNTLQVNGAFFYYDYTDKQILGAIPDPIFGSLPALVNVPKSHVIGFDLSGVWEPISGLRLSPSVSYAKTQIDGTFRNFDAFFNSALNGQSKNFSGEPFPNAPKWQVNFDGEYDFPIGTWTAFVGANVNYQSATRAFFYDRCNEVGVACTDTFLNSNPQNYGDRFLNIIPRALLDVRAGVERGPWRVWFWGRNVTNKYYWYNNLHVNDVLLRWSGKPATYGLTVSYDYGK
jgi:outer membrane receptor protein involved in Fe transport